MANSSSLTDFIENRNDEPNIKPIWKTEVTFVVEAGGGHAELSHTVPVNGVLLGTTIEVGTTTQGSETVNVDLDDGSGVEFSANASLAENSETSLSFFKAVTSVIIRVDPGDDPDSGDDWLIVVTLRGI